MDELLRHDPVAFLQEIKQHADAHKHEDAIHVDTILRVIAHMIEDKIADNPQIQDALKMMQRTISARLMGIAELRQECKHVTNPNMIPRHIIMPPLKHEGFDEREVDQYLRKDRIHARLKDHRPRMCLPHHLWKQRTKHIDWNAGLFTHLPTITETWREVEAEASDLIQKEGHLMNYLRACECASCRKLLRSLESK